MKTFTIFCWCEEQYMPKLHLTQLGFTYSGCSSFTKHFEVIQKFREINDLNCIYKSELSKAYFVNDAADVDCKDLAKKSVSEKVLKDGTCEIALNPQYDGY